MGVLLFEVAGQRYGLDIADVVEVVPTVRLRRVPQAPPWVAGLFTYRGAMVPVLDVSLMMEAAPVARYFSTRIILVRQPGAAQPPRLLGLLVERATDTVDDEGPARAPGIATPEAPYLGPFHGSRAAAFQRVFVEHLLSDDARQRLLEV